MFALITKKKGWCFKIALVQTYSLATTLPSLTRSHSTLKLVAGGKSVKQNDSHIYMHFYSLVFLFLNLYFEYIYSFGLFCILWFLSFFRSFFLFIDILYIFICSFCGCNVHKELKSVTYTNEKWKNCRTTSDGECLFITQLFTTLRSLKRKEKSVKGDNSPLACTNILCIKLARIAAVTRFWC